MQITKWKSFRLLWFPWFAFHLYVYVKYSFFLEFPDAIQFARSLITTSVLIGCIFYACGVRCFVRLFWQTLLVIGVIDELIGVYEEGGYDLATSAVVWTFYFVLALYAFQNKAIWNLQKRNEI